jgi:hypothetical protein
MLSAQIGLNQVLKRGQLSLAPQNPSDLSGALSRVCKVIDFVFKIQTSKILEILASLKRDGRNCEVRIA